MLNLKRKSLTQLFIIVVLFYICYLFGLFTHLLEKDLKDFRYPSQLDLRLAIQRLQNDENSIRYTDINENNYTFIYKSENICVINEYPYKKQQYPYLLILVKSKLDNFDQRQAIRNTWSAKKNNEFPIRTVFLVGIQQPSDFYDDVKFKRALNGDYSLTKKLQDEYDKYGDIVQQNFYDTYYNNTLKAIMGLKWIDMYCSNSNFYLFIDDDYFLNPNLLIKYLNTNVTDAQLNYFYAGYVFENSSPMRHLLSKWYISLDEYPYDKFPPYVSAGCYLLSRQSVRLFHMASKLVTKFRFDDIYMGILAHKLKIKPVQVDNIYFYAPYFDIDFYSNKVIASHEFPSERLIMVWKQLNW